MYSPVRTRKISRNASMTNPTTKSSSARLISGRRQTNASFGRTRLETAQDPARREEGPDEVEGRVPDHDEGLDRGRQLHQPPVFGKVPELRVVDRVGSPVHDRVLPDDRRRRQHHQQIGVGRAPSPRPYEHGDEQEHHDDRPDLMQGEPPGVGHPEQEFHRTGNTRHLRVRDARGDGAHARVVGDDPEHRDGEQGPERSHR